MRRNTSLILTAVLLTTMLPALAVAQSSPAALRAQIASLEAKLQALRDSLAASVRGGPTVAGDTVFYVENGGISEHPPGLMDIGRNHAFGSGHLFGDSIRYRIVGYDDSQAFPDSIPRWVVQDNRGNRAWESVPHAKVSHAEAALAFFSRRARFSRLQVVGVAPSSPNSAGGVDVSIAYRNTDPRRVIKYLTFTVTPYNAVGDPVSSQIGGLRQAQVRVTGPIEPRAPYDAGVWSNVWYNSTITCVVLNRVEVAYTDGSWHTYTRELPSILHPVMRNSCAMRQQQKS